MPFIVRQGNAVELIAAFSDARGNVTTPPSAQLVITYTATNGSTASQSLTMLPLSLHGYLTATWNSSVAALGLAIMNIVAPTGSLAPPDPIMRICQGF